MSFTSLRAILDYGTVTCRKCRTRQLVTLSPDRRRVLWEVVCSWPTVPAGHPAWHTRREAQQLGVNAQSYAPAHVAQPSQRYHEVQHIAQSHIAYCMAQNATAINLCVGVPIYTGGVTVCACGASHCFMLLSDILVLILKCRCM